MPYKDREKQKQYQRDHYRKNKDSYIKRHTQRRQDRKAWFLGVTKGISCRLCGELERCCLSFHHLDPSQKDQSVSKLLNDFRSKKRILEEVKKCVVLCENCHRKVHAGVIKLDVAQ